MIPRKSLQLLVLVPLAAASLASGVARAQVANRIQRSIDPAQTQRLPNHHPMWAVPANDAGAVPANLPIARNTCCVAEAFPSSSGMLGVEAASTSGLTFALAARRMRENA